MSWRLAFHSTKLLFSYLIPAKVKIFRDAIFDGKIATIRELAANRPRLLQQSIDADGNTAIGLAILLADVEVVKTLLELGSDPNLANAFDGNHPLVFLARLRSEENSKTMLLADLLLKAGSSPLHEVRYQADTANRIDATQTPSFHETPLFCCIRYQNIDLLKKMIEYQTDINIPNPEAGITALMLAASLGYHNICEILIDAGADIHAVDLAGNTSLHLAVQGYGEQGPVIQTLLRHGADINAVNEDGCTPMMLAKQLENDASLKVLNLYTNDKIDPPAYQEFDGVKEEHREEHKDEKMFSFT